MEDPVRTFLFQLLLQCHPFFNQGFGIEQSKQVEILLAPSVISKKVLHGHLPPWFGQINANDDICLPVLLKPANTVIGLSLLKREKKLIQNNEWVAV
jgi:hypothetical protein